jgi:Glycosyltransferase sugar-binding region containing DXD motif
MCNKIINGVWRGSELTNIQKLCIRSFQDHGHEFHLWVEQPVIGVPKGTVIRNTIEVLSVPIPSFSGANFYSDYLRVVLINKIGGWYVDLDEVCLKPLDFESEYVFVSEIWDQDSSKTVESGCIFKSPKNSPFLKYIISEIEHSDTMHPSDWIAFGPTMFRKAIACFGFQKFIQPPEVFDPLRPEHLKGFINGKQFLDLSQSYTLHLRTSFWNGVQSGLYPNGSYHLNSLFEQLKRKHGIIA